jgi:hypothetical protein
MARGPARNHWQQQKKRINNLAETEDLHEEALGLARPQEQKDAKQNKGDAHDQKIPPSGIVLPV